MRNIFIIILINGLFAHTLFSQTLIQQIENAYNSLDSISYIENIMLSFRKEVEEWYKEMDDTMLELYGFDYINMDSIQRQNIIDSIMGKTMYTKYRIENRINYLISAIEDKSAHYILELRVDSCGQSVCLLPTTGSFTFNLFYFDNRSRANFVLYIRNGQYSGHDSGYYSFSRIIARNLPKVFRKILRKNPKYLLLCDELEGMNTILYVLNDKIYVYRIAQMKEYELDDYSKKFWSIYLRAYNAKQITP